MICVFYLMCFFFFIMFDGKCEDAAPQSPILTTKVRLDFEIKVTGIVGPLDPLRV